MRSDSPTVGAGRRRRSLAAFALVLGAVVLLFGLGLTANGFFHLADDEALIVTVDAKGARYLLDWECPWFPVVESCLRLDESGAVQAPEATA